MSSSSLQSEHVERCQVCRATLTPGATFCASCGASTHESPEQILRYTTYILSELARWEEEGLIEPERAAILRAVYEKRRDDLRALIEDELERERRMEIARERAAHREAPPRPAPVNIYETPATIDADPPSAVSTLAPEFEQDDSSLPSEEIPVEKRTLVETLTDPHTLRLLLYTGAAMLVVGVVIWLRDVLYLKLQEPVVQAALLATGTVAVTIGGWFAILRTRLLLTGRALTLVGSLLVPVNFWFLVRSGLIQNHGRAWMVCALCASVYAVTAAVLEEKLYVYLAAGATIATLWALVYRADPESYGMYALTLMLVSLLFLHLSRVFPAARSMTDDEESAHRQDDDEVRAIRGGRWSRELWTTPLVRAGLAGAVFSCFAYALLRVGPTLSLRENVFQFWSHVYDPSVAALLFAAGAYALWYAARRYAETQKRIPLYALAALVIFCAEYFIVDGLRLPAQSQLLALAAGVFIISLAARFSGTEAASLGLYGAGAILCVILLLAAVPVTFNASDLSFTDSASLAFLAVSFALLSTPLLSNRLAQNFFGYGSVLLASAAFLIGVNSAHVQSRSLFVIADAAWLFALYFSSRAAKSGEEQLSAPLRRIADVGMLLLFGWASLVALISYLGPESYETYFRRAMFCALAGVILYGFMRAWRDRSKLGAATMTAAALVFVAASLDSLQSVGVWPNSWPIALGVVFAAFALRELLRRVLSAREVDENIGDARNLETVVSLVADSAVIACAAVGFFSALLSINEGGFAASAVLLATLAYWCERAALKQLAWLALVAATHSVAFFIALLIGFGVNVRWFATASVLLLFPLFFAIAHLAKKRDATWVAQPAELSALSVLVLGAIASLSQAMAYLNVGDMELRAPAMAFGSIALATLAACFFTTGLARIRYLRAGLCATVMAFWLICLHRGFDPWNDVEIYTAPAGALLLVVAFLAVRRRWDEYAQDTILLLWTGAILLAGPILIRALQFRLFFDTPATTRDLITLSTSLALIIFGVLGRLRAPVLVGATTLVIELSSLVLTSVDWLQVPLKVYLITVGALILLVWGTLEYRREQFLEMRRRFQQQRTYARQEFGRWR